MVRNLYGAAYGRILTAAVALALILMGGSVRLAQAQDVLPAAEGETDATITLQPVADAYVVEGQLANTNFGAEPDLRVAEVFSALAGQFSTYSLLRFDLSIFPVGTKIENATLTLPQTAAQEGGDWTILVRRVAAPWDEATVTYANQPGSITTRHTFVSPQTANIDVSADLTELISNTVNFPINNPNYGILLAGTPQVNQGIARVFGSGESAAPPRLTIRYTLPPIRICQQHIDGCNPAGGAVVYNRTNGLVRVADATGAIDTTNFALGHVLWARWVQTGANNGTLNWTTPQLVTIAESEYVNTGNGQELWIAVRSDAPLWLQNLDVSAQWHVQGTPGGDADLRVRVLSASQHLYAITDGQFALGRVTVRQNYEGWEGADFHLYASNTLQPKAIIGGVVAAETPDINPSIPISYAPGEISMGSYWNRFGSPPNSTNVFEGNTFSEAQLADDWALALAHEFGHFLLFLFDTYTGVDGVASLPLTKLCTGTAMGDVYQPTNQGFHWDPAVWKNLCGETQAYARHQGRTEWDTIQGFYPWAIKPTSFVPGPALPAPVTSVVFVAPANAGAAAAQTFNLDYVDDELSSGEARAFLLRSGRVLEQGQPAEGSTVVQLTGAEVGDRLCVYDIDDHAEGTAMPRHQFGCEIIAAGDDTLQLTKNVAWAPEVALLQVGPQSLSVQVTQPVAGPAAPLQVRVFPEHGTGLAPVTLPVAGDSYSITIVLTQPVPPLHVQIFVQEAPALPQTRREVIVDRGTGGGGAFGPARAYGDVLVYSADGDASFEGDAPLTLEPGQSIAWQTMPGTPLIPFHKTIVGQSYRLDAFPASLVENGTVRIRFDDNAGVAAAGTAGAAQAGAGEKAIYFWDGSTWTALQTQTTVPAGSTDGVLLASARSQGIGVYAVLSDSPAGNLGFLPMVLEE